MNGYIVDCSYVKRVRDYMTLFPLITVTVEVFDYEPSLGNGED